MNKWTWGVVILIGLAIVGALGGSDDSDEPDKNPAATERPEPERPFRATPGDIEELINDELGATSGDRPRVKDVFCAQRTCVANYRSKELILGEDEGIRDQLPIWKTLFSDKRLREATLIPHTTLISVGGKERNGPFMRITCTRAHHRQINWDAVDEDGVKEICDYALLVESD